jgi:hypothetical protein
VPLLRRAEADGGFVVPSTGVGIGTAIQAIKQDRSRRASGPAGFEARARALGAFCR